MFIIMIDAFARALSCVFTIVVIKLLVNITDSVG